MSRDNPYRSPQPPPLALPPAHTQRPTSFYRLWLILAMLISLAQLRFRGVYDAMEIELPELTAWAMRPIFPLIVLFVGIVLGQMSRHLRSDHHSWLRWTSVIMVATLCLAFGILLYLPLLTIDTSLH